ncbi:uncharacterized protein LOC113550651 [Rhopalosiphum maidis]|uniref:uncharacterized protein LOC113550651 n=1 Tax=Rhopalosiphum maidis TaxID=43146 RepID=UPI000EFEBE85|nr:uncharacterized protein LOC113550651 [Rhopalosiphum maidis]
MAEVPSDVVESSSNVVESPCSVSMRPEIVWNFDDSTCSSVVSNNTPYAEDMSYQRELSEVSFIHAEKKYQLQLKKAQYALKELVKEKERQERNNQALREQLSKNNQEDKNIKKRELELRQQLKHCERQTLQLRKQLDQKNREIEKHRIENAELDEEKHTYFLRSTEHEHRVIELTEELEHLRLTNENLRRTKLKRNAVDEKYNSIQDIYKSKLGLDRLEMLVVTWTGDAMCNYQYHGFRRKLKGMLHAINLKTNVVRGDSVQLWFVTNNAKQDFIDCKGYLKTEAERTTGVTLKMSANNINLVDTLNVDKFNTVEVFREFGKMIGMIELDAKFLQTILELSQNQVQSTSASTVRNQSKSTDATEKLTKFISQQPDKMLQDIYKYVLDDFNHKHVSQTQ